MRGAYRALDQGAISTYATAAFEAYFGENLDVAKPEVLVQIAERAGLDTSGFLDDLERPEIKARVRATTDELARRGGFGSPTFFVNDADMYFGNDRLPLLRAALARG